MRERRAGGVDEAADGPYVAASAVVEIIGGGYLMHRRGAALSDADSKSQGRCRRPADSPTTMAG